MDNRTLVALSGGVDSSVAAARLLEEGHTCVGARMRLYAEAPNDEADARAVAEALGIPFHILDLSERFETCVIHGFVEAYANGRTPNPCVACNRYLKFDSFFREAQELGCDTLATGHYARVERDPVSGRFLLRTALDASKDQSYVLYTLTQEQLAHARFPLGTLRKADVRRIASARGLKNADRPESQDICFIPDGDYSAFIERFTGQSFPEGDFIDRDGHVLGRHRGIIHYTVGQRKGLGVAFGKPMYVLRVNAEDNTVTLGTNEELFTDTLLARDINLIARDHLDAPTRVTAKVRYRHPAQPATAEQLDGDTLRVVFDEPQRAITPGQSVVLYDGDIVVGGGCIAQYGYGDHGSNNRKIGI